MKTLRALSLWLAAALIGLLIVAPVRAYETNVLVRDPSTVVKSGNTYWVYGTGTGAQQFSSTDRIHWTRRGPALPTAPAWLAAIVPGNKNNVVWAPDIHFFNGQWRLYYSYSQWGTSISAIGVATNPDINNPRGWTDQGMVVRSANGSGFNAIDPCIFQDATGVPWLSYGSYGNGIHLIRIDPQTGKQAADDPKVYDVAARLSVPGNAIEASAVTYHEGYYYLFVAWDGCCAGARSSYNIRMGRSRTVTGPYLDKDGKDMHDGGGTLFLGSVYDNGSGRLCDDEVGPGHFGILHDRDGDWVSFHEEWARDNGGATTLNLLRLAWDGDGWARPVLDPGPYKIVVNLATHDLASVVKDSTADGSSLHTWPDAGGDAQKWTLHYQGDGYYSLIGVRSRKALTVADSPARPGAKVTIAPFAERDGQFWYLRQNDNGTYTLLPKSGGRSVALDVGDCNPADGTPIGLWTANGLPCQEWSFHVR
ncbi:MAG: family 43 glycosylhydrolase [Armatimonadetes bacterium]|nr:family 43 glycosylhydrolase [Armatimonadota bacterium]